MTEIEKSLKLAELMGWATYYNDVSHAVEIDDIYNNGMGLLYDYEETLEPFEDSQAGRAQFAAIILKFPNVILRVANNNISKSDLKIKPTQSNILDEILRMNFVNA